jgi:hypothetical protein
VYRRIGTTLGLEASRVAYGIETLPRRERFIRVMPSGAPIVLYEDEPYEPEPPILQIVQRTMQLPARQSRPPNELKAEANVMVAEMNRLRREGTEEEIRLATAKATQAGWRVENARLCYGKTTIPWEMQCIRIGSIVLLSVAGEPFIETANRIVAESPFEHTLFSGYSNGGFGYIPTREAYNEGGYEVEASPFSPDAADVVVEEGIRLLHTLAAKGASGI